MTMNTDTKQNKRKTKDMIDYFISRIVLELTFATEKFNAFNSTHEGYAVILEELDELWDEIKANSDSKTMSKEAIQVAAMALRFLVDCCYNDFPETYMSDGRR